MIRFIIEHTIITILSLCILLININFRIVTGDFCCKSMAEQQTASNTNLKPGKWPLKIIHAGQIRTGSASLSVALNKLGYGPVHHFVTNELDSVDRSKFAWNWFYENLPKANKGQDVDWDEFFKKCGVYSALDVPIYLYWETIFKKYPNIKVILTVRDSFDIWYESASKFHEIIFELMPLWYKIILIFNNLHNPLFGLPIEGKEVSILLKSQVGEYGGWNKFLSDKQGTKKKYKEREEYVKSIVPKDQLLIFNVKSGWKPLCDFLDIPQQEIPTEDFPHINNANHLQSVVSDYHKRELQRFVINRVIPGIIIGITAYIGYKRYKGLGNNYF